VGVANLINILAPDMIILGGGVMNMADLMLPHIATTAKNNSLSPAGDGVKIVKAKLGSDAGVLGAAALCLIKL
jgi:glucokinase